MIPFSSILCWSSCRVDSFSVGLEVVKLWHLAVLGVIGVKFINKCASPKAWNSSFVCWPLLGFVKVSLRSRLFLKTLLKLYIHFLYTILTVARYNLLKKKSRQILNTVWASTWLSSQQLSFYNHSLNQNFHKINQKSCY